MPQTFDIVIAGGAIIGSSLAYFLSAHPDFKGRVAVIEKDLTFERSSTVRSASSIRQQFTTAINIDIAKFGIHFLKNAEAYLGLPDETTGVQFIERGYLLLADAAKRPSMEANVAFQQRHDVPVRFLELDELARQFPWINLDGLVGAATTSEGEGWFDANILLNALRRKAAAGGITYIQDEVATLNQGAGGRIDSVSTKTGVTYGCGLFVNATGAIANDLSKQVGLPIPVTPRKRVVFVVDCRQSFPNGTTVIDPNGLTIRPEGARWIVHFPPTPESDVDTTDIDTIDHDEFQDRIWEPLAHRVPAFEASKVTSVWAGLYDFNVFDHNALLGIVDAVPNMVFANGFSGHGVMQGPAVGRGLAEFIVEGAYRSIDLSPLWVGRFFENRPLEEKNVF
jgi:sarcosine oxidase